MNNDQQQILISYLRKKQQEQGIKYLTTDDRPYKVLRFFLTVLFCLCIAINILYLLSNYSLLKTNMSFLSNPNSLQKTQIAAIRGSLLTVGLMTVALLACFILLLCKKYLLHITGTAFCCFVLIWHFALRLSDHGSTLTLLVRHAVPLIVLFALSAAVGIIALRQQKKDKDGCNEIAGQIYNKYSLLAENLNEEQWNEALRAFELPSQSKKRSVKTRLKKADKSAK